MKRVIASVLALGFAGVVYAGCVTNTVVTPNGQLVVCTTCCENGMCTTTCAQ